MSNRGSMNHIRLSVTDLQASSPFYAAVLRYLDYELLEKTDDLQGWARTGPGGNLQWMVLATAEDDTSIDRYERGAPGLQHLALNAESRDDVRGLAAHMANLGKSAVMLKPAEYDYEIGY
jgi:glyoxylase I family protein